MPEGKVRPADKLQRMCSAGNHLRGGDAVFGGLWGHARVVVAHADAVLEHAQQLRPHYHPVQRKRRVCIHM